MNVRKKKLTLTPWKKGKREIEIELCKDEKDILS